MFNNQRSVMYFVRRATIWASALCWLSAAAGAMAENGKPPSELPPKTKMALKLAGLVAFVASSCPDIKPDYARFKTAVRGLGIGVDDLEKKDFKATYLSYTLRYKADREKNCARALTDFGPGGTVVADLLRPAK